MVSPNIPINSFLITGEIIRGLNIVASIAEHCTSPHALQSTALSILSKETGDPPEKIISDIKAALHFITQLNHSAKSAGF